MAVGRPTDYKVEYAEQARKLCLLGATDAKLADFFEVSEVTINAWKKKYPEFLKSLKEGKMIADATVSESLYHRAIGYSHPEVKVFNNQGEIVTHDVIKHYAPDPTSAIFWLKNRQPEMWRDKPQEETISDTPIGKIQIEVVSANSND